MHESWIYWSFTEDKGWRGRKRFIFSEFYDRQNVVQISGVRTLVGSVKYLLFLLRWKGQTLFLCSYFAYPNKPFFCALMDEY